MQRRHFPANIIIGDDGRIRFLWRAVFYFVLAGYVLPPLFDRLTSPLAQAWRIEPGLSPGSLGVSEGVIFLSALVVTALLALSERRRVDSYGLPLGQAFGTHTLEGFLAGIFIAGGVAVAMIALGGMQVAGLALHGSAIARWAAVWFLVNTLVGVAEEFWFRSYLLQSLWKSIGFWPASLVIAAIFASAHYFFKKGENIWDVITLVWFSLLICYSVLKTGSLWFGVGLHAAFDFMQLFVIGTPNGGQVPQHRLLDATFHGPAWLTGGTLGTEASFIMYPLLALVTLYVWLRFRPTRPTPASVPN